MHFSQIFTKLLGIWPRESRNQNLKQIHAIGSEITDATDGRRTDGRRRNFDYMSSADVVKLIIRKDDFFKSVIFHPGLALGRPATDI